MLRGPASALPARCIVIACIVFLGGAGAALAQSSLGIGAAEPSINTGGFLPGFFAWVNAQQQAFYRALTDALAAMRDNPWNLTGLVGLSFAYGIFHAAGPGHGKAVISSYMVANEVALRRGIMLSFASALMQGCVAIVVVAVTYLVLRGSSISMTDATRGLEIASFAAVTAFGAWLVYRKLVRFQPMRQSFAAPATAMAADSANRHGGHGHAHYFAAASHGEHDTHHHHGHGESEICSSCGHSHAPDPEFLKAGKLEMRDAWSAVAAVGMRPCSGALIVLTFALLNGLFLGGVLSVFAMSIGTAITVAALASMAVGAKGLALRYAAGTTKFARITDGIEIFGALCVLLIGLTLLTAALAA